MSTNGPITRADLEAVHHAVLRDVAHAAERAADRFAAISIASDLLGAFTEELRRFSRDKP